MGRFSPPVVPPPSTRLAVDPAGPFHAGDLVLTGGIGTEVADVGDGRFIINGALGRPRIGTHLFIPGTLAAGWEATLYNPEVAGAAYLTMIEVNLGTAPSGVDAENHLALRVAGTLSGSVDLPLSAEQTRFLFDQVAGTEVLGASADLDDGIGVVNMVGIAQEVEPTGNLTLTAMRTIINQDGFAFPPPYGPGGLNKRFRVYNADRTEIIAETIRSNELFPDVEVVRNFGLPFPVPVELEQGERYWIAFEQDGVVATRHRGSNGALLNTVDTRGANRLNMLQIPNGASGSFLAGEDGNAAATTSFDAWALAGVGGPTSVFLAGDVVVSLVAVGTPPVTPGADANINLTWGTE